MTLAVGTVPNHFVASTARMMAESQTEDMTAALPKNA